MMNEISIMQKTHSHFVAGYLESYSEDTKIYIVMEYC
jgi:serine/threonine protein kinase